MTEQGSTDERGRNSRAFWDGLMMGLAAPVLLFDAGASPPPHVKIPSISVKMVSAREALSADMCRIGHDLRSAMDKHGKGRCTVSS